MNDLSSTWLNEKYKNGEINTSLPYISVTEPDFYADGDDAEAIINEINMHYNSNDCTTEEAFNWWVSLYLCN